MTEQQGVATPHYVPILKGRLDEFIALEHVSPNIRTAMTPLVEVSSSSLEINDDGEVNPTSVDASLGKFMTRLATKWPNGSRIIIDAGSMPPTAAGTAAIASLTERFGMVGRVVIPTVRPSDSRSEVVEPLAAALSRFGYDAACIRLAGEDLDDTEAPLQEGIDSLLGSLMLAPSQIDLVLDLGAVADDQSASFASRVARLVLAELPHIDAWRTVVVAAGAFPADLGSVPPGVLSEIPRIESAMWSGIRDRWRGRPIDFGDYAIAHPVSATGAAFAPAPQLRYTAAASWLAMKGRRSDRRGALQFFDICSRLIQHPEFTPGRSWGDDYITAAAHAAVTDDVLAVRPGNAMIWRAIGTSHHLAYVVSRLASGGAP